jgi:hypothetical protein
MAAATLYHLAVTKAERGSFVEVLTAQECEGPLGRPMGDVSPELRRIRKEEQKNAQARASLTARRMKRRIEQSRQWRLDQMQRQERARRELEEHQRRLADELDQAIAKTGRTLGLP